MTSVDIRGAASLATPLGRSARRGREQNEILRLRQPAVRAEDGILVFVGTETDYRREYAGRPADVTVDAAGKTLLPGFVDAHTHPVWVGDRGAEIGRRLAGESYASIAASGGGILATVRATRAASEKELSEAVHRRLRAMLAHGATTVEAKSGYGLTAEDEIRALRLLRALQGPAVPRIVPTLLAAHEFPPEYQDRREEWVRLICHEIVPLVAREGLARYCDVFCEEGVFSVEESRTILEAARRAGLGLRVHADELGRSGGTLLAADLGAASADHLLFAG
ncbi:MAG: imidazolonepropionase, partial [Acidobacteria bacterium]